MHDDITDVGDDPILDLDKLAILERENAMLGQALTHWIGRYFGLMAAVALIPAEQVLPSVAREAAAINARLESRSA